MIETISDINQFKEDGQDPWSILPIIVFHLLISPAFLTVCNAVAKVSTNFSDANFRASNKLS